MLLIAIFAPLTFYSAQCALHIFPKTLDRKPDTRASLQTGILFCENIRTMHVLEKICNRVKVMHLSGIYAPLGRLASSLESLHICENMHPYKKCLVFRLFAKLWVQNSEKGLFTANSKFLPKPQTFRLSISIV